MDTQASFHADLLVRSFIHVARQLTEAKVHAAPREQYAQIHSAAEKHNCALALMLRDATTMADKKLRNQLITEAEHARLCKNAAQSIAKAQEEIAAALAQYAEHRLAA